MDLADSPGDHDGPRRDLLIGGAFGIKRVIG
jgi:hypothetical protein